MGIGKPEPDLRSAIAAAIEARGDGKTICPSEVARALAGPDETEWRRLMKPIRAVAMRMAQDGLLTIRRKGRIVDPGDFKGVYRLGRVPDAADRVGDEAAEAGAGNKAPIRPVSR